MGTQSVTLVRVRMNKQNFKPSNLGNPTESQYHYEYFACIYHNHDGYVEGGIGEWLAKFICEFISDFKGSSDWFNSGFAGAKLIEAFFSMNESQDPRLMPIRSLKEIFQNNYEYVYIITFNEDEIIHGKINDSSIMLSVYEHRDYILTARPEKFLKKYQHYKTQMEEMRKSFAEIDYGDDEVEKEGYLSEDKILVEFLK